MSQAPAPASRFPWPALVTVVLVTAVSAAGVAGLLQAPAERLGQAGALPSLILAALALGPLGLYAMALERGKPAPALRGALAPWALFGALHLGVLLSGGPQSPLAGAYPLFFVLLGRHAGWLGSVALLLLLTLLQSVPLSKALQEGAAIWPQALSLGLPWLGFAAGSLSRGQSSKPEARRIVSELAAPAAAPLPDPSAGLPFQPKAALDPLAQLNNELGAMLQVAHNALPSLDALTLWWGDDTGVQLQQGRLRSGQLSLGARLTPGESLLGLVLKDKAPLSVEPLAATAAAELPYRSEPAPARCLIVLPLSDEGRLVGLLAADKLDAEDFSPEESQALRGLAQQAVGVAQRYAHLARLEAGGARTQRLYEAVQALGADMDREVLLQRFNELLQGLVPCDSWTLGMREEEEPAPLLRLASHNYLASAPATLSLDASSALAGSLAHAEGALLFNRVEGAQVPAVLQEGMLGEGQHFLLAPLRLGGHLRGVLKLDRRRQPFSQEDRELAFIFGNQAAGVLENARLFSLHRRLATTDGLTGLYNHRYFQERLALELEKAERSGKPLSLALTDIDFFKKFNDTFGHQEGDVVLRKVAHLVRDMARQGKDIVARYGGEEFVVILPDCDIVEARQVMDALRAHCARHLIGGSGPEARAITLSIGLCSYPQGAKEQRELIHVADTALYKAKHSGRNQVCSYKDL